MSQIYYRRTGEEYVEIIEIDHGRFLVDLTPRGIALAMNDALLMFDDPIPEHERLLRFVKRSLDENFEHMAWEEQEQKSES